MTGYSFSTPVWDGRTWVRPAVAEVAVAPKANGPEDRPRERNAPAEWNKIDWQEHEGQVRRLRQRIFKASQEQDWPRVRNLQKLQPDPPCSPPWMFPAHLRHRHLNHLGNLTRATMWTVRAVGQPGQLPSQIPGHPPVHSRPVHSSPGGYFDNLSAIQDRADRVQALLDNRQDNQCQSRPPQPDAPRKRRTRVAETGPPSHIC